MTLPALPSSAWATAPLGLAPKVRGVCPQRWASSSGRRGRLVARSFSADAADARRLDSAAAAFNKGACRRMGALEGRAGLDKGVVARRPPHPSAAGRWQQRASPVPQACKRARTKTSWWQRRWRGSRQRCRRSIARSSSRGSSRSVAQAEHSAAGRSRVPAGGQWRRGRRAGSVGECTLLSQLEEWVAGWTHQTRG